MQARVSVISGQIIIINVIIIIIITMIYNNNDNNNSNNSNNNNYHCYHYYYFYHHHFISRLSTSFSFIIINIVFLFIYLFFFLGGGEARKVHYLRTLYYTILWYNKPFTAGSFQVVYCTQFFRLQCEIIILLGHNWVNSTSSPATQ